MAFTKDICDLTFSDIESLQADKIPEGHMLDYKRALIDDEKLIKHVIAFANTGGGYIVFGVEESGRGGHPESIPGIDASEINKERIEQIMLGNVSPRIHVRLHAVDHKEEGRQILILQIPDSQYRPHYDNRTNRFYKRFEFEAVCMTEQEISDAYKSRFHMTEKTEEYLDSMEDLFDDEVEILGEVIVIPSSIERKLIDTDDPQKFEWLNHKTVNPEPSGMIYASSFVPGRPAPFSNGIECSYEKDRLRLHRNGCVHYFVDCGYKHEGGIVLHENLLAVRILHTLKFAVLPLSRYNYFGDVRIRIRLRSNSERVRIGQGSVFPPEKPLGKFKKNVDIQVNRELSIEYLKSNPERITASIMNEVFNNFGVWRCPLFDEDGRMKTEAL